MTDQQTLPTFTRVCTLLMALALALVVAQPAGAQTENVIYNFAVGSGVGGGPMGGLIADSAGNLYGAAGSNDGGAAYELIPSSGGVWTLKVLHEFGSSGLVGPYTGFTRDAAGNLYGASTFGGSNGWGAVFELKPISNGTWREQTLYSFSNSNVDGHYPAATLTLDAAGNLYGATQQGGLKNVGVVFKLTPSATGGGWKETILYSLPYKEEHWNFSDYPLAMDASGNLYGVTNTGGALGGGYVFKLSPTHSGPWAFTTLYSFGLWGSGPLSPWSGVVFDSAGNLYGVTAGGGTEGVGTVYQLSPSSGGRWRERTLVNFPSSCSPTCRPESGIVVDSSGNIFGTAIGGAFSFGSAYKVSPNGDGTWTLTSLHDFVSGNDAAYPTSGALLDISGKLYGTSGEGGTSNRGTVYEITP